jgi:hypothetical protein
LFDTTAGGGSGDFPEIEFPLIEAHNNVLWMDDPSNPYFFWNEKTNQFTNFGVNAVNSNWGTSNMAGGIGTGWASGVSPYAFQGASNMLDVLGVGNLKGVSSQPFDLLTFLPGASLVNAGASLPANAPKLPVRFRFGPSAVSVMRLQPLTMGAVE